MPDALLRIQRTVTFDDGHSRTEEFAHRWTGYSAAQAYDTRAGNLRSAKSDSDYDRRQRRIVTRHQRAGYVEVEVRQFEEAGGDA